MKHAGDNVTKVVARATRKASTRLASLVCLTLCASVGPVVVAHGQPAQLVGVTSDDRVESGARDAPPPPVAPVLPNHVTTTGVESADVQLARIVVDRARALFEVRDYDAALAEFMHAYRLLAGDARQAAVLNNIAVCYERLFRYDLALQFYERLLTEATATPSESAEIEALIRGLRDLLGSLAITSNVRSEVWVDNHAIGKAGPKPSVFLVPAGSHLVEIRARGFESARGEARVSAGSSQRQHFDLEALPHYRGLDAGYFWTGAALTVAAVSVGTVLGVSAMNAHASGVREAEQGLRPDGQRAKDFAFAADIAFGAAFVLGASSIVLFSLTNWNAGALQQADDLARGTLSIAPAISSTSLLAVVSGALP